MIYALLFVVSLHSLVAATLSSPLFSHEGLEATALLEHLKATPSIRTTLSKGEAHAFESVFGTSNVPELLEIERDPVAFWEKREAALQDEAIPHVEFCQRYAKEALDYIKEKSSKSDYHPWFCCDPNAIKDTIKLKISEDHPAFPTALALYTALACDHLEYPHHSRIAATIKTKKHLLQNLGELLKKTGFSEEFNQKQIWVIRKNALFSIFDDLIAMRSGKYLCGATPAQAQQRMSFKAHENDPNNPDIWGFHGPISHDSLAHALRRLLVQNYLSHYGVSYQEHFNLCWDKTTLIKGNIILLAQQSIGCFYNSHELPTVIGAWRKHNLLSLLYPYAHGLTDQGFLQITPYFINEDPHHNWRKTPIIPCHKQTREDEENFTHLTMIRWANKYCGSQNEAHYAVCRTRYLDNKPLSPREKFFRNIKQILSTGDRDYDDRGWFKHPIIPFSAPEETVSRITLIITDSGACMYTEEEIPT